MRTAGWDVAHAFGTSVEGWLVLVARRHIAAVADLTESEAAELGPLIKAVSDALQATTGCEKTYVAQFAEAADHRHVHLHVIPRSAELADDHRGPGIFGLLGLAPDECVPEDRMTDIALRTRTYLLRPASAADARVLREDSDPWDYGRLSMSVGEAIFTQRSIRRFRPDPIPLADIRLIVEAAVRAPNGGNQQVARFLVVTDRATIHEFGGLYHEAWWAKRSDEGFKHRNDLPARFHPAARLADAMGAVPCIVFALALGDGPADSVVPAVQNLMLAARAIGIGSVPTTLHPSVMPRFRAMFGVPDDVAFHFCVPLGYPQGRFGPNVRKPTSETTYLDRWQGRVPWA